MVFWMPSLTDNWVAVEFAKSHHVSSKITYLCNLKPAAKLLRKKFQLLNQTNLLRNLNLGILGVSILSGGAINIAKITSQHVGGPAFGHSSASHLLVFFEEVFKGFFSGEFLNRNELHLKQYQSTENALRMHQDASGSSGH